MTPTYSACPATLAIELAIETAVAAAGHDVRVRRVLAPAWTTDWITPAGRAKLKQAGIAPPSPRGEVCALTRRGCRVDFKSDSLGLDKGAISTSRCPVTPTLQRSSSYIRADNTSSDGIKGLACLGDRGRHG